MQAAPVELQPPKFRKSGHTAAEEALGARTQRGMLMAKKPKMWKKRMMPSKEGRALTAKALKRRAKMQTAIVMTVPCL